MGHEDYFRWCDAPIFADLAREGYARFEKAGAMLVGVPTRTSSEELPDDDTRLRLDVAREQTRAATVVVVFAALAFEAFIFDYAARALGDRRAWKDFDHGPPPWRLAKAILAASGNEWPECDPSYGLLVSLFRERNRLAHARSAPVESGERLPTEICARDTWAEKAVSLAARALRDVTRQIDTYDPQADAVATLGELSGGDRL